MCDHDEDSTTEEMMECPDCQEQIEASMRDALASYRTEYLTGAGLAQGHPRRQQIEDECREAGRPSPFPNGA